MAIIMHRINANGGLVEVLDKALEIAFEMKEADDN
jgi:hypothetical protein